MQGVTLSESGTRVPGLLNIPELKETVGVTV